MQAKEGRFLHFQSRGTQAWGGLPKVMLEVSGRAGIESSFSSSQS